MMKRLKKLTALLTAIGMVAAMSACGSDARFQRSCFFCRFRRYRSSACRYRGCRSC